jgi:hypothetical protein
VIDDTDRKEQRTVSLANVKFFNNESRLCSSRPGHWFSSSFNLLFKGGAERLIVDAATGLSKKGNQVTVFTSHHDPNHAFPETLDGTLTKRFMVRNLFSLSCWRLFTQKYVGTLPHCLCHFKKPCSFLFFVKTCMDG